MKQQQYSFEIQGLRGISILAVMLFHFGGVHLPGGYAGVDMFFVISGYVITQLIVREHRAGRFTLSGFYKNRVIRLLPNLFAMIVATLVIGYFLLLPFDFSQFGKSLQFTAVYLTNMVFARQQGYFDLSREVKPLLHTWSLSIEEQFYLFFPLLLVMLWRFRYRRWMVFGLLFVCSLAWKVWVIQQDHVSSFFSFPGRIWEFMIGAMAAQVSDDIRQRFARNEWLSVVAILSILLTFLFLDERIPYAGVWVAASCFATAILILSSHGTRVGAVLSGKQLVFAGALSYSLSPTPPALRNSDPCSVDCGDVRRGVSGMAVHRSTAASEQGSLFRKAGGVGDTGVRGLRHRRRRIYLWQKRDGRALPHMGEGAAELAGFRSVQGSGR